MSSPADLEAIVQQNFQRAYSQVKKAQAERDAAQSKLERAEGRLEALRRVLLDMRNFAAHSPASRAEPEVRQRIDNGNLDWQNMPRSKAILTMLRQIGKPTGPADLSRALKEVGRSKDQPNYVSSTLDFLKKRGKVQSLGEGQWVPIDQEGPGDAKAGTLLEGGGD